MDLLKLLSIYRNFLSGLGSNKIRKASVTLLQEGGSYVTFPVVPADLPPIETEQNNETFNSVIGDIATIGLLGLRKISFDDWLLPEHKYDWATAANGYDIINFINNARLQDKPFRLIITKGNNTYINMSCVINTMSYYQDNIGDYHLSCEFMEYRTYNTITGGLSS